MMYDATAKGGLNPLHWSVTVDALAVAFSPAPASGGAIQGRPVLGPMMSTTSFDAMLSPN